MAVENEDVVDPQTSAFRSVWRVIDFRKLWFGQGASFLGSQVTLVALPVTAALTLDAGPFQMGVLAALNRAPYILFGLIAGVWVDRVRRRQLLIVVNLALACIMAIVPVAAGVGQLTLNVLFVVAFMSGIFAVFFDIAYLAFVPNVVPRRYLTNAQAMIEVTQSSGQMVGPALAGWLVQIFTAPLVILMDSITYILAAVSVWSIGDTGSRPDRSTGGSLEQIREGIRAVFGQPVLRAVTLTTAFLMFWLSGFNALFFLYLVDDLSASPVLVGAIFAVGAVGGLLGATVAAGLGRRFGVGPTMGGALVSVGVGAGLAPLAVFPGQRLGLVVVTVSHVFTWAGQQIFAVHQVPIRYVLCPERLYGRVNATIRTVVWSSAAVGSLLGGVVGNRFGLPLALTACSIGAAASAGGVVLSPVKRIGTVANLEA